MESIAYTTIFLDLDHTLWDYETSSRETLQQLLTDFSLTNKYGIKSEDFQRHFEVINRDLWSSYDAGTIDRETIRVERFKRIMEKYFIRDEVLELELSDQYLLHCPSKSHLLPFARECLEYLGSRYKLLILTNGFDDVQQVKLNSSGISHFFDEIITSETTGHRKPSKEIFKHALSVSNSSPATTLMIGDSLQSDIAGAINSKLHAMFYNPKRIRHSLQPRYEIHCLSEIRNLL